MADMDGGAMFNASASFRESLKCSICLDTFKSPKALSCLHTFCQECIQSIIDNGNRAGRENSIVCPECRQKTKPPSNVEKTEWARNLPTNWPLMRFIERLENIQRDIPENGPESGDEVFGQVPVNQRDLEECQQIEMCLIHHGKKMIFYCLEHSAMFCEDCKNDVHRWGCTVVTIASVASDETITSNTTKIEKQFQDINERLDKTKNTLDRDMSNVRAKIDNFQARMLKIRGQVDQLLNEMQEAMCSTKFREENIKKFSEYQSSKVTECDDLKAAMEYNRSEMSTVLNYGTSTQRFIATEQLLRLMPTFEKAADDKLKSARRVEIRHEGIEILNSVLHMKRHMFNVEGLHVKLEN